MGATVADVARPFHYRDCDTWCYGECIQLMQNGNRAWLGSVERAELLLEQERLRTQFVGRYEDPSTWRRVAVATAAAVAPPEDEITWCRHYVPLDEFCPDCAPPADEEIPQDVQVELW